MSTTRKPTIDIEDLLSTACEILKREKAQGKRVNITAVAREFGVNRRTLSDRFHEKHASRRKAHAKQQHLPPIQEVVLEEWIIHQANQGEAIGMLEIRKMVFELRKCSGEELKYVSRHWISRFLKRHPHLHAACASGLDPKRARAFNPRSTKHHFDVLGTLIKKKGITPKNTYNADEKGEQQGGGRGHSPYKYIFPAEHHSARYRKRSDNLALSTIIECISADGEALLPHFIFKGPRYHRSWFTVGNGINVSTSPNGWVDNELFLEWFHKTFLPQAKARNTDGGPILLIFDGHGSHVQDELRHVATKNDVFLYCLPSHTTHKLQPLDVGVFGPLQNRWRERCHQIVQETGEEMPRSQFVLEYMAIHDRVFAPKLILKAWERTGIRPWDSNIFKEADFAPSYASSLTPILPPSFTIQPYSMKELEPELTIEEDDGDDAWVTDTEDEWEDSGHHDDHSRLKATKYDFSALKASEIQTRTIHPLRIPLVSLLQQSLSRTEQEKAALKTDLEEAQAKNYLIRTQLDEVQRKLASKSGKRRQQTIKTDSRCLNSEEVIETDRVVNEIREELQSAKDVTQAERSAKDAERRAALGPDYEFKGPIGRLRQFELQNIASKLGIHFPGDKKVTNQMYISAITAYFADNYLVKLDPRFNQLRFPGETNKRPHPLDEHHDENQLNSRRRRLSPAPGHPPPTVSFQEAPLNASPLDTFQMDLSNPLVFPPSFSQSDFSSAPPGILTETGNTVGQPMEIDTYIKYPYAYPM